MKLLKVRLIVFAIVSIFSPFFVPTNQAFALCDTGTCYVARDGSGDFNCDGTDDHVQIQQALVYASSHSGTTVFLKGPATYNVDPNNMYVGSNTTVTGNSTAVVKLKPQDYHNPNSTTRAIFQANSESNHDITFYGFKIDGNLAAHASIVAYANDHLNTIQLVGTSNVIVHDMVLKDGFGDGVKVWHTTDDYLTKNTNVHIYNNIIDKTGHDNIWVTRASNVSIHDNFCSNRDNSGVRITNSKDVSIYNNDLTSEDHGGAGIELQKVGPQGMYNIEIYNNYIHHNRTMGIYVYGYGEYEKNTATGLHIHHNLITGNGLRTEESGGIVIAGFDGTLIENNVIDGNFRVGIAHRLAYADRGVYDFPGSGYVTIVRNNIITNTSLRSGLSAAYGISNELSSTHSFILQNNDVWNNASSNYSGVSAGSSDISSDPLFASSTDYHLKSQAGRWNGSAWVTDTVSSPCIDTGYSSSLYANEPVPNGGIINIGRYGNTTQASLSGTVVIVPPDPVEDPFSYTPSPSNPSDPSSPSHSSSLPTSFIPPSFTPEGTTYVPPTLTVINGSGSGIYNVGDVITITADAPSSLLYVFRSWYGATDYIADPNSPATTVTIPNESITITALYEHAPFSVIFSKFSSADNVMELVADLLQWLLSMAGIIGFIVIIIGGIYYIASSGDEQKATTGKKIVTQAVFGLVVILLSYAIISLIEQIFV